MSIQEWLMHHLPAWLLPWRDWGAKGRPDMPEKHDAVNRQQAVSLRLDRLDQRARRETEERTRYEDWHGHWGG